jgi:hypothetical protein
MKKTFLLLISILLIFSILYANKKEKNISIIDIKENPIIMKNKKISGVLCSNGEFFRVREFDSFNDDCICGNYYISYWVVFENDSLEIKK